MQDEKGFSLIETIVAVAIAAIVVPIFLGGLATSTRATFSADIMTTAENLAISQIEDAKEQPYDATNNPPVYSLIADIPAPYTITVDASRLDYDGDGLDDDDGIQSIVVRVQHDGHQLITLEDYKIKS